MPLERRIARQFFYKMPTRDYVHFLAEQPLSNRWQPGNEKKEKTASQIADIVLGRCKIANLSPDEWLDLSKDIQEQDLIRGSDATKDILPDKDIPGLLSQVRRGSRQQALMGLGGGAVGGLVGGTSGALIGALARGKKYAPISGLIGIAPGIIGGHAVGQQLQQRKELADLLREKL